MTLTEQYQKGDLVVYTRLSILTRVESYVWAEVYSNEKPKLLGLALECGLTVELSEVRRATAAECNRQDPALVNV